MNDDDGDGHVFPEIAVAARRCDLDTEALAESALASYEAGFPRRQAVAMNIIEALRRRGAYHGRLKQAIDDGTIFQFCEDDADGGNHGRCGRVGAGSVAADSAVSPLRRGRGVLDAG